MNVVMLKDCNIYDPKSGEKIATVEEEIHPVTQRGTYYDIITYRVIFHNAWPDPQGPDKVSIFKDYQLKNFLFSTGYRIANQPDNLLKMFMGG
uniref:Uncharacterized protein n=1 Tax=viral metagenome TaxID=1070528 RepID=A0A6M3LPD5_9ZZZZ